MTGEHLPDVVQTVLDNGRVEYILTNKLVECIAEELQNLEIQTEHRYNQSRTIPVKML